MVSGAGIASPPAPTQLPVGGVVAAGAATISTAGSTMNINQASNRVAINWSGFDIGSNATVNFVQPSASSVALNRVNSPNPSQIFGSLNANGQVFLMNSAGVYFAPGANVNVGGIVATTHQMGDADFMNGSTTFTQGKASGSIINDGTIKTGIGGYIALLAPEVQNNGVLLAQQGTIALAGGEAITLNFGALSKLDSLTITPSLLNTLIDNRSLIQAPDGLVILSARAVNQLTGSVVNSGTIEADGISQSGGRIILEASSSINHSGVISANAAPSSNGNGGTISIIADLSNPNSQTNISGSISAQGGALGGDGGQVETSGSNLNIANSASVTTLAPLGKTGTWLLDPTNFTIASGAGVQTTSGMGADALTTALNSNSVNITTAATGSDPGDINVNAPVSWSANMLTLTAANSVNVNAAMNISGTGTLAMNTGLTGSVNTGFGPTGTFAGKVNFTQSGTGWLAINGNPYTIINSFGTTVFWRI